MALYQQTGIINESSHTSVIFPSGVGLNLEQDIDSAKF